MPLTFKLSGIRHRHTFCSIQYSIPFQNVDIAFRIEGILNEREKKTTDKKKGEKKKINCLMGMFSIGIQHGA